MAALGRLRVRGPMAKKHEHNIVPTISGGLIIMMMMMMIAFQSKALTTRTYRHIFCMDLDLDMRT